MKLFYGLVFQLHFEHNESYMFFKENKYLFSSPNTTEKPPGQTKIKPHYFRFHSFQNYNNLAWAALKPAFVFSLSRGFTEQLNNANKIARSRVHAAAAVHMQMTAAWYSGVSVVMKTALAGL